VEAWALSIGEQRMLRMSDMRMVMRADEYILTLVVLALQRNDEAESATIFTLDALDGEALAEMLNGCIGQEGGD
jgi:hypothetical protein